MKNRTLIGYFLLVSAMTTYAQPLNPETKCTIIYASDGANAAADAGRYM